ncbi:hypothetical protein [Streptacidiphilus melanogenes]|uniref:hypothetical protein n=1 Tax=Streptacidiphilus melanogenes TaxID=411235 RepID=UPI0005AA4C2D|nr:hypothetical protein [Streptacidiphilus melanogenes]
MTIRDPYAATHFEPDCAECESLWERMLAAGSAPDWEQQVQLVTVQNQAHARDAHNLTLATGEGVS